MIYFYAGGMILVSVIAVTLLLRDRYYMKRSDLRREQALQRERTRIARDIHDDLGNGLVAVATLSDLAHADVEKGTIHQRLDEIYEVAQELARNVDEIVWAVNPENDTWKSFISYFEQYTTHFLSHANLRSQFVCPPPDLDLVVPSKIRHHLVLAVREAVGNVLKHAQAESLKVELRYVAGRLEAEITDDGKGFDTDKPRHIGHDGLNNMDRRMDELGGECRITSAPGAGTTVFFSVPLKG